MLRIKIIFTFILAANILFGQDWSQYFPTHYRHLNDIYFHNIETISFVGGHPYNDSITYMAFTETGATSWKNFYDIFPGTMLRTQVFIDSDLGFSAGDKATLFKTTTKGEYWEEKSFDINLNNRRVNRLVKSQYDVLYAAGGNNDTSGFLIKSSDVGETWELISEWSENEIYGLHSVLNNQIVICGSDALLKISDNGGESWGTANIEQPITEEHMKFMDIDYYDEQILYCGGGRQGADSLAIILKSIDGGQNWNVVLFENAPQINAISIISDSLVYAVGDYGYVIKTEDGGETWNYINIPDNPNVNFYAVNFINEHYGAITGHYGYIFIFNDGQTSVPTISISNAAEITDNAAKINVTLNSGFVATNLKLYIGKTLEETIELDIGTYYNGENTIIPITFNDLEPDTKYYYFATIMNEYGEYSTNIKSFYTGNPIPNWDFEEWNEFNGTFPSDWFSLGSVEKILSGDDAAVRVFTNQQLNMNGAVVNGNIVADLVQNQPVVYEAIGGHPFNFKAQEFSCKLKYNIYEGDSAFLALVLKKQGNIISSNFYFLVGNTNYNIVDTTFDIEYDIDIIPDTVIFGFTNTSFNFDNPVGQSFVEMYNVWFENTNENCLNHDFEQWFDFSYEYPVGWGFEEFDGMHNWGEQTYPFFKTEDAFHNKFALCLQLNETSDEPVIYTQANTRWIPVTERHDFLEAYIKYLPDGIDTAHINIEFKTGINQYYGRHIDIVDEINDWTKISIPLYYENDTIIPDSVSIFITSTRYENPKYSQLCIDKICFDGDYIPVEAIEYADWQVFPNPIVNNVTILSNHINGDYKVDVYSASMTLISSIIKNNAQNEIKLDLSKYKSGMYFIKMLSTADNVEKTFKIIKL